MGDEKQDHLVELGTQLKNEQDRTGRIRKRKVLPNRVVNDGSLESKPHVTLKSSPETPEPCGPVPPQLRSYPVSIMEPLRRLKDGRK